MLCPGIVVGSTKPRLFLKAELTDFSQILYPLYSTISWWLCFTSLTPLSLLNWGAPKLTDYCRCGLPVGWMDLLAQLVLILTIELLQPLLPGHPAQSAFPPDPIPAKQCQPAPHTCPAWHLNFIKVLLAHFSSLSSSIPTSAPSVTACASLHWLKL